MRVKVTAAVIEKNGKILIAKRKKGGRLAIRACPRSGFIYIHADCWGDDITCQSTRAGGIYNGRDNIYAWLNNFHDESQYR